MAGPLEQFEIKTIFPMDIAGFDVSFTNASLWMVMAVLTAFAFFMVATSKRKIVPGLLQAFAENLYDVTGTMVKENIGKGGKTYFPFIFTLFIFVLTGNLLGMVPGGFTFTSHLAVTGAMSTVIFIAVTAIGFAKHGLKFFSLFFPSGAPILSAPILVPIEIISYFSRPISMGLRLCINMFAGHVLLKVLAGFIVALGSMFALLGALPFLVVVGITVLEIMVAVIQAYVFAILACVYLHDSLHLH